MLSATASSAGQTNNVDSVKDGFDVAQYRSFKDKLEEQQDKSAAMAIEEMNAPRTYSHN